jgi:PadR family transcriptional regulator, regulatory protein PadR
MKDCCDMRGFLSFHVLRMISQQEMSGDDIRRELERRKGCMPSAGTVYPVLKALRQGGFIQEIAAEGRTKKYKITEKGKREAERATKQFVAIFCDLKDEFRKS